MPAILRVYAEDFFDCGYVSLCDSWQAFPDLLFGMRFVGGAPAGGALLGLTVLSQIAQNADPAFAQYSAGLLVRERRTLITHGDFACASLEANHVAEGMAIRRVAGTIPFVDPLQFNLSTRHQGSENGAAALSLAAETHSPIRLEFSTDSGIGGRPIAEPLRHLLGLRQCPEDDIW
jgi:hypothetical protein